jgi:hypothetical protein
MSDLLMVLLTVAVVAAAGGYVLACAHLTRPQH